MTTQNTTDSNEQQGEAISEVAQCAQAVLTALNVGDVQSGSPLHLKLREVMIAYRERVAMGPALTDERVDAFIREHENDPVDEAQLERVRQRFKEKLSPAASSPAPAEPPTDKQLQSVADRVNAGVAQMDQSQKVDAATMQIEINPTATPPTTPSAAAMRAAEELKSLGLLWDVGAMVELGGEPFDENEQIERVAAVITRHLAAAHQPKSLLRDPVHVRVLPPPIVTRDGVPCDDQAAALEEFKQRCREATTSPACDKCGERLDNDCGLCPTSTTCCHCRLAALLDDKEAGCIHGVPVCATCGTAATTPSPETAVGGEAQKCVKCNHVKSYNNVTSSRYECYEGGPPPCGCKCEFIGRENG